ncbi:putative suppressive immunomodulating factor [Trypanosoma grayi]|uniref:putative suppressive immunomodulating factor n=1 Tax=Trypanosoma grayi TaxID=71804 RepID=UPI0004F4A20A|nr:putative suppressive immunomodulating factor [Trypanosoma grayi]KEG10077.1 putative suppressive immunomodulating factor [Trypanosoma grayi]
MASPLTLRELDTHERDDQLLLERFELCRHDVARVSSSPILPDCIAVTTKGGFVELINIATGAFRVFLSHLGGTPLESPLRCFALVPALYAARGTHHLLYSIAYSNELLLADMECGGVEVLATFHSRPSVVFCDGDHMACGEGCGQVALWRVHGGATLVWRRPVFSDTVICLTVEREYVCCASADYRCHVLSLTSGEVVATLAQEPAPAVALQPIADAQLSRGLTAVCLPGVLSVYSPPHKDGVVAVTAAAAAAAAVAATGTVWECVGALRLDVQISCASCCAGFMAFGTNSGVVLLMGVDAVSGAVEELVRFDVGFAVVGAQLFPSGTLVVVTSAGDVWKWAVTDLLPAEGDAAAESDDVPLPNLQPPAAEELATTTKVEAVAEAATSQGERDDGSSSQQKDERSCDDEDSTEDEEEIVVVMDEDAASSLLSSSSSSRRSAGEGYDIGVLRDGVGDASLDPNLITDEKPSSDAPAVAVCGDVASLGAAAHDAADGGWSERSLPPSSISVLGCTTGVADTLRSACVAPLRPSPNADTPLLQPVPGTAGAIGRDAKEQHRDEAMVTKNDAAAKRGSTSSLSPHALQQALRGAELGPPAVISGLRAGRRMDPRKARHIVESGVPATLSTTTTTTTVAVPLSVPESQSSKMLVDHRQALEDAAFSYAEYAKMHPLKVEALKYRYPVKLPVYGLHEQVFVPTDARLKDRPENNDGNVEGGDAHSQPPPQPPLRQQPPVIDDLMDATFRNFTRRKDAALEKERRRGGPDILRHSCDSLLFTPPDASATVLFNEYRVQPGVPDTLLLPMPLPPTPSVF